jgi:hypothetical protein
MTDTPDEPPVKMAFEGRSVQVPIASIQPLRQITAAVRKSMKFAQIRASIGEVGIIEPPVVWPLPRSKGKYLLLDGHLRLAALKEMGETEVECLVSTDDEAFTYNRHISRLATIQEHRMILKAVERGVPPARIARALRIEPAGLRKKIRLLDGICSETAELLKDKHVPINSFHVLRRMLPYRQIEVAENMVQMNCFTTTFAQSLLAGTPEADLVDGAKPKRVRGLTAQQMSMMERESANLDREFRMIEETLGVDLLDLVLASGYVGRLLGNAGVVRYLAQHNPDILPEFQKIVEMSKDAGQLNGSAQPPTAPPT